MNTTALPPNVTQSAPSAATIRFYDILFNIIGFILTGSAGIMGNVLALIIISKNQSLHSPCFILIAGACVSSLFIALGFLAYSIQAALVAAGLMDPTRPRALCFLSHGFVDLLGIEASSLITPCIACDRLWGMLYPLRYRNMGNRYAYVTLIFCFSFATVSSISCVFSTLEDMKRLVQCVITFSGFTPFYVLRSHRSHRYRCFTLSLSGLCVSLYIAMLISFRWRKRRLHLANQSDQMFMKHQLAALPTVRLLMILYTLTAILPEVIGVSRLIWLNTAPYLARGWYYFSVVKCATTCTEFTALIFGSQTFRKCARDYLKVNSHSKVSPMKRNGNQQFDPADMENGGARVNEP